MNILDAIAEHKRVEILKRKRDYPLSRLETFPCYGRKTNRIPMLDEDGRAGIIAEFKRRSPSAGLISGTADPVSVAGGYRDAGAAAVSILTDRKFFGGSFRDLQGVRQAYPDLVLLRKDFIINPYQLHESSALGADMVLLIAALLDGGQVAELATEARKLGLHVLLEVHDREELDRYHASIGFVGVNNRDLRTFKVDPGKSMELIRHMPEGVTAVSESGISRSRDIRMLRDAGFRLFLVGQALMGTGDPGAACRELVRELEE